MVKALVIASIGWPLFLAAVVWTVAAGHASWWTSAAYAFCSFVCHQIPSRSFHTAGVQWPVCGRCAGLYLSAPVGVVAGAIRGASRLDLAARVRSARTIAAIAALPTAVTLALQWTHIAPGSNLLRAVCALPLGAAIGFLLVDAAAGPAKSNRVN